MTCDEFEMDWHSSIYRKRGGEWDIKARDGDMKVEFSVYDESVQEAIEENFPYISDTVERVLLQYAYNRADDGVIDEIEHEQFIDLLRRILP